MYFIRAADDDGRERKTEEAPIMYDLCAKTIRSIECPTCWRSTNPSDLITLAHIANRVKKILASPPAAFASVQRRVTLLLRLVACYDFSNLTAMLSITGGLNSSQPTRLSPLILIVSRVSDLKLFSSQGTN